MFTGHVVHGDSIVIGCRVGMYALYIEHIDIAKFTFIKTIYLAHREEVKAMKCFSIVTFISVSSLVLIAHNAYAHSEKNSSAKCHNEMATGEYHCHDANRPRSIGSMEGIKLAEATAVDKFGQLAIYKPTASTNPGNVSKPLVRLEEQKSTIQQVQRYLNRVGFSAGEADGVYGQQTRSAIVSYQTKKNLLTDGEISSELLTFIQQEVKDEFEDSIQKALVERTQEYLQLHKLYAGPRNGILNELTIESIMRFQSDNRLSVNGKVSERLLKTLKKTL